MLCFLCEHKVTSTKCSQLVKRSNVKICRLIIDIIGPACQVNIGTEDEICETCTILLEDFYEFQTKVKFLQKLLQRQVNRTYNLNAKPLPKFDLDQRAQRTFSQNDQKEYKCKHCAYQTQIKENILSHFLFHNRDYDISDEELESEEENGKSSSDKSESLIKFENIHPIPTSDESETEHNLVNKTYKTKKGIENQKSFELIENPETALETEILTIEKFEIDRLEDESETEQKFQVNTNKNREIEYENAAKLIEQNQKKTLTIEIVHLENENISELEQENQSDAEDENMEVLMYDEMSIKEEPDEQIIDIMERIETLDDEMTEIEEQTNTIEQRFCAQCGESFPNSNSLIKHMKLVHSHCMICNKIYKDKRSLNRHFQVVHEGQGAQFTCDFCSETYSTKSGFIKHFKRHIGIEPFKCLHCDRSYWDKAHYMSHISQHTKIPNYICILCGKTFSSASTHRLHMRYHETPTPFKCKTCPKAYASASSLAIHRRMHTGEMLYKCEFCDKGFASKGTYKIHRIQHVHEYPYNCTECNGKGFTKKRDFARHMKNYHNDSSFMVIKQPEYKIAINRIQEMTNSNVQ